MQTGTLTERCQSCGADGAKAEDQGGSGRLRETKMYSWAGARADQAGTRIPAVSLTRVGKNTRRVGFDLHDSQSSEVSQDMLRVKRGRNEKKVESGKRILRRMPIIGAVPSLDDAHCTG